jgi:hypothetical protein
VGRRNPIGGRVSVSLIDDMVSSGRITPADGARLLELRRLVAWRRKPWWQRWAIIAWRAVFS